MKLTILGGTVIAVTGCVTSSRTYGPDGRVVYSIICKGAG